MAKKITSAKVASKASKALSDGRSSARTKSIAGSALSQREKSGKLPKSLNLGCVIVSGQTETITFLC